MTRRTLLALLAIPVFFLAAIPAVAKKAKASGAPVVTSIKPMKLKIGEKLTIHGRNFIIGRHKDTIVFMGAGKRVVWVKADTASKNTLTVKLPTKLAVLLADKTGKQQPTRLLIRVIGRKSGRAFTKASKSPIVSPNTVLPGTPQAEACPGVSVAGGDSDGDFLSNGLELALGTNACKADSDGDGVSDGYEYQAALDLNRNANSSSIPWPYPGKRPYPNPLDPSDTNTDFDGDSLTLSEEYTASFAWLLHMDPGHQLGTFVPYVPNPNPYNDVMVVAYSDGDQTTNPTAQGNTVNDQSGPPAPANATDQAPFDVNGDGAINASDTYGFIDADGDGSTLFDDRPSWFNYLNQPTLGDDEKDVDGDGLSNYDEAHGPMSGPAWWTKDPISKNDGTYYIPYTGTNWLDRDTDGDSIPDGADDQDHDGYTNIEEDYGAYVAGPFMAAASLLGHDITVHAFNPCLPNAMSPACTRHPTADYAPYKAGSRQETWDAWPAP